MKPKYCQYCGAPLDEGCECLRELAEGCECLRELAEYEADLLEELENRPETQLGYRQQDLIDSYRFER